MDWWAKLEKIKTDCLWMVIKINHSLKFQNINFAFVQKTGK